MPFTFKISVRLYLGYPVTQPVCDIYPCNQLPVVPHGQHGGKHAKCRIKRRHDGIRDVIAAFLQHLRTSGQTDLVCELEKCMDELGIPPRLGRPAIDSYVARCDFALMDLIHQRTIVADVMVTHPKFENPDTSTTPLCTAKAGVAKKSTHYTANYMIAAEDVKPLVFETYGGWAVETLTCLKQLITVISKNDDEVFGQLWRELRNRIAVALAKGHVSVIQTINSRQKTALGKRTAGIVPTNLSADDESKDEEGLNGDSQQ